MKTTTRYRTGILEKKTLTSAAVSFGKINNKTITGMHLHIETHYKIDIKKTTFEENISPAPPSWNNRAWPNYRSEEKGGKGSTCELNRINKKENICM
jgi:hypothetical protein